MTDLISEWLEEEKLNAPNVAPLPSPPGPSVETIVETKTVSVGASE